MVMQSKKELELFFTQFLREFRTGLRREDQTFVDKLVKDLVAISMEIPPQGNQYSFREILMLMVILNQKKIDKIKREK